MASRTLLVNAEDNQKAAYMIANEALEVVIKNLQAGNPIKNAYLAARGYIQEKDPNLANKIHSSFGFGVIIFKLSYYLLI